MTEIVVRSALKGDIKPGVVLWLVGEDEPKSVPYLVSEVEGVVSGDFAAMDINHILGDNYLGTIRGFLDEGCWFVSGDDDTSNIVLDALIRVAELSAVTPSQGPPTVDSGDPQPGDMYTDPHGQVFILVEDLGYSKWNTAYMYDDTWRITTLDHLQREAMRRLPHTHRLDVTAPDWLRLPDTRPLPDYLPRLESIDGKHNVRFTDVDGVSHDLQFHHSVHDEVYIADDPFHGPVATTYKDCLLDRRFVAAFTKTDAGVWVHDATRQPAEPDVSTVSTETTETGADVNNPPILKHSDCCGARFTDETGETHVLPRFDPGHNTEVHVAMSVTGVVYVCDPENPGRVATFQRETPTSTEWVYKP